MSKLYFICYSSVCPVCIKKPIDTTHKTTKASWTTFPISNLLKILLTCKGSHCSHLCRALFNANFDKLKCTTVNNLIDVVQMQSPAGTPERIFGVGGGQGQLSPPPPPPNRHQMNSLHPSHRADLESHFFMGSHRPREKLKFELWKSQC